MKNCLLLLTLAICPLAISSAGCSSAADTSVETPDSPKPVVGDAEPVTPSEN